jgi:hypothetical protein
MQETILVPVFGKQGCVVTAYHPITIVTEIKPKIKRQKVVNVG